MFVGIQKIENQYLLNKVNSNEYANIYYPDIKKIKRMAGKEDYVGIPHLFVHTIS